MLVGEARLASKDNREQDAKAPDIGRSGVVSVASQDFYILSAKFIVLERVDLPGGA